MKIDITDFAKSKKLHITLLCLVGCIVLLVVFQAGILVGYHKASFSIRSAENYARVFGHKTTGVGDMMMRGLDQDDLPGSHGAVGKIVSINLPTMVVSSVENVEKTIYINPDTIIRKMQDSLASTSVEVGDMVVVIGSPDDAKNVVVAKFIRVVPQ